MLRIRGMGKIVFALMFVVFSGCQTSDERVDDLATAGAIDMRADAFSPQDFASIEDAASAADLSTAPDLLALDLIEPWCGELLQHTCPDDAPKPGCRAGLAVMSRGNDAEDTHCFDPGECGATAGAACCSISGGTISAPSGYCPLPLTCKTTCQL